MKIRPASLKEANKFVHDHHRHHGTVVGHKFAIGVMDDAGILKGVAICGRPISRKMDDGFTLEVARLCVLELPNGCSKLYAACARVAKELGYTKIITYILQSEPGISLKASGWINDANNSGSEEWNSSGKMRRSSSTTDLFGTHPKYPAEMKSRWIKILN